MARRSVVRVTRGRDNGVRVRVRSCGWLLGGLVLVSGCGATSVTMERVVLAQYEVPLGEQHVAELDRTSLGLRQDGDGVLVSASEQRWCQRRVRDEADLEERVVRKRGGETTGTVLGLTGAGLVLIGVPLASSQGNDSAAGGEQVLGVFAVMGGLGLAVAGLIVAGASSAGSSEERHPVHYVGPERQLPLTACSERAAGPSRVELVLPDGSVLLGARSRTGLWRVAVDAALWEKYGSRIDADVRVDGVAIQRVVLERQSP